MLSKDSASTAHTIVDFKVKFLFVIDIELLALEYKQVWIIFELLL